jgi:hypothetical protein
MWSSPRASWSWRAEALTAATTGIRSGWENLLAALPDFGGEIDEVRDLGDVTVARARLRGHGAESGVPVEQTAWQVVEWRDKKAIWWGFFRSEAEALEAAGLRE